MTDSEVENALGKAYKPIKIIGEKGTILAEDTRGLHKGGVVNGKSRLLIQLQFTNCLFGANYPKVKLENVSDTLATMKEKYPRVYSSIVT